MGIVFRQSVKSTIVIFIGNFLGVLFNYFGTYVFGSRLQELGFSRIIFYLGSVVQFIILLGSAAVIQIFIQRYQADDERKRVLITFCALLPLATVILLLPAYIVFRQEIVQLFQAKDQVYFLKYYLWILVLILVWSYMTLFEAYLLSQHKTALGMFMKEVLLRVVSIVILAFFYFGWIDFHTFIISSVLAYCVPVAVLLWSSSHTEGFGFSLRWRAFSKVEYKEIAHFAWYHLLSNISFALIGYFDALLLTILGPGGLKAVPVYVISVFIAGIMMIPFRAMATAVVPVLNQAYIDRNQEKLEHIFRRSGVNILVVAVGMSMIIGLNLKNAVAVLPPGYDNVLPLVLIMMLGKMADMATGLNNEVISISSLYKFNFRIALVLVVLIVGLNLLLIPRYGAFGAAWGVSLSMVIFNVAKAVFLQRKMHLHPFSKENLKIVLIGICISAGVYFIPFMVHPVLDAFLRTGIITVSYLLLLLWLRPSEDINTYVRSVISNKKLF